MKSDLNGGAINNLLHKPAFWAASIFSIAALAVAITITCSQSSSNGDWPASDARALPGELQDGPATALESNSIKSQAIHTPRTSAAALQGPVATGGEGTALEADPFALEHLIDEDGGFGFSVTPEQEARYRDINTNPAYPDLETRMLEMQARRNGKAFSAEAVLAALSTPALWAANDRAVEALALTAEEVHDGREFLSVNRLKIETMVPGDVISLPVAFETGSLQMKVERVRVGTAGAVTWYGKVLEFESENQVSITQGAAITIGGITTPNGVYMMESRAESGWIIPTGTLFKNVEEEDGIYPPKAMKSGSL